MPCPHRADCTSRPFTPRLAAQFTSSSRFQRLGFVSREIDGQDDATGWGIDASATSTAWCGGSGAWPWRCTDRGPIGQRLPPARRHSDARVPRHAGSGRQRRSRSAPYGCPALTEPPTQRSAQRGCNAAGPEAPSAKPATGAKCCAQTPPCGPTRRAFPPSQQRNTSNSASACFAACYAAGNRSAGCQATGPGNPLAMASRRAGADRGNLRSAVVAQSQGPARRSRIRTPATPASPTNASRPVFASGARDRA